MRLIAPLTAAGPMQMAVDEALLDAAVEATARLYAWDPPAISLGYFQDYAAIARELPSGMAIVRRITGGGAIWHEHEVTYCLVGTLGQDGLPERARDCYPLLHGAIRRSLAKRGVELTLQDAARGDRRYRDEPRCFASPAIDDLVHADGGKVLGSAARTRGTRMLLHGSLKLASNPWDADSAASCGLNWDEAAAVVLEAVSQAFDAVLEPGELTAAEELARDRIVSERYGSAGWVQDRSGPRP
jgi:lipoate-protein ligase A